MGDNLDKVMEVLKGLQKDVLALKTKATEETETENAPAERLAGIDEDAISLFAEGSVDDEENQEEEKEEADGILSEMLGEFAEQPEGPPVIDGLAKVISARFATELPAEALKEKVDQLKRPGNCPELSVPKTNPEIWGGLTKQARLGDLKLAAIQRQVTAGACALASAANTAFLIKKKEVPASSITEVAKGVVDALTLLGKTHRDLSLARRDALRPSIGTDYTDICATSAPLSSELLFGEDLERRQKEMAAAAKMTKMTRKTDETSHLRQQRQTRAPYYRPGYTRGGTQSRGSRNAGSSRPPFLGVRSRRGQSTRSPAHRERK